MWIFALRAPRSTSSACCSVLERCSNPAWKSSRHSHTSFIVAQPLRHTRMAGASCRDSCGAASMPHGCYGLGPHRGPGLLSRALALPAAGTILTVSLRADDGP